MTKKNTITQIMAFLALFWIIIWIIWTWLLIIFSGWNTTEQTVTAEQFLEMQEVINSKSEVIVKEVENNTETLTWEIK